MTQLKRLLRSKKRGLAALGLSFALLGASHDASACGGFFCSTSPVDQTAEHILFTLNADHTITAVVQISYQGDRDAFAWIVPVPGVPVLGASFPDLALRALDTATQPSYFKKQCYPLMYAGAGGAASTAGADAGAPSPVTVLAQKLVGPYETVTLAATNATDLVDWLKTHNYRITDAMIPVLQPYVENGLHFVALRLQADRTAADVTPLEMTYSSDKPMIPIRLTSVAAQPEMGIVTFILGDRRWGPDNYFDLKISDSLIEFDQFGSQNNYLKIVSQEIDKVGGQAFVTEYAKGTTDLANRIQNQFAPTPEGMAARQALIDLLGRFPYLTRLYTRMSAEEMVVGQDPTFIVSGDPSDVSNVHDLTPPGFSYSMCAHEPPTDPCFLTYCGRSGACVPTLPTTTGGSSGGTTTPAAPACFCAAGSTARPTLTAYGQPLMYCEPLAMNLDTGAAQSAVTAIPACEGFSCGAHGECVPMNGNPTCRCDAGYGAVASQTYDPTTGASKTQVTCEFVGYRSFMLPNLPPIGQTRMPARDVNAVGGCSVSVARSSAPKGQPGDGERGLAIVGLGALGMLGIGRRRARRIR